MAEAAEHTAPAESHGNSTAAWTGVAILLVGSALICLGLIWAMPILWILGIVGVVGGAVAWIVLTRAGYGDGGPKNTMGH